MAAVEELPEQPETAFKVTKDRLGHYYFCIPRQVPIRSENQAPKSVHGVVSLDPGVRTFQTAYDSEGRVCEWGKDDMKQIFKLCKFADELQSRIDQEKGRRKYRMRLAWHRMLDRIRNLVDEVHKKAASWLCENYKVILIPTFESSKMVKRGKRKIKSKTARSMVTWSHYRFRQRVIEKSELFPWCQVIECIEPYTSKTCGNCGVVNVKLGGSKVFKCNPCGYKVDRDINGARNILIRYLTVHGIRPSTAMC